MFPILEHYGFDVVEGHYGKVRCLFHDDRVASATWSEYYYKCFGCEAHGDAVRLIMEREGLDWREAYSRAKDWTGVRDQSVRAESSAGRGVSFEQRIQRGSRKFIPPGGRR